jgi:hypothetical protein
MKKPGVENLLQTHLKLFLPHIIEKKRDDFQYENTAYFKVP